MANKTNGQDQTGQSQQKLTILEVVRRALQTLGRDAKPAQLHPFIKEHYGRDIRPDLLSKYKRDVFRQDQEGRRGKGAGKKKAARKQKATSRGQTTQKSVPARETKA